MISFMDGVLAFSRDISPGILCPISFSGVPVRDQILATILV